MRLGIYRGTFSPPHSGHVGAARAFAEQMGLDRLLIIPTAIPPHKMIGGGDDPCGITDAGMERHGGIEIGEEGIEGLVCASFRAEGTSSFCSAAPI